MHVPEITERYGLYLEGYLRGCGAALRAELIKQNEGMSAMLKAVFMRVLTCLVVLDKLNGVALVVKKTELEKRKEVLHDVCSQTTTQHNHNRNRNHTHNQHILTGGGDSYWAS